MSELIFLVEEDPEGGFTAQAVGEPIVTQTETIAELKPMIRDAIVTTIVQPNGRN